MGTPAPDAVKRLVDRFDQDRKVFLSGDHKDEQHRLEFLNPFFGELRRDMDETLDTIQNRKVSVPLFPGNGSARTRRPRSYTASSRPDLRRLARRIGMASLVERIAIVRR
jgi:hypothetical protein